MRTVWAVLRRDLWSGRAQPLATLLSILVPLNFLVLMALFALSGGHAPVALAVEDRGTYAQPFVQALTATDTFDLQRVASPAAGLARVSAHDAIGVIEIPAGFSRDVAAGRPARIGLTLDNLNHDFAEDARRGLSLAVALFERDHLPRAQSISWNIDYTYPHTVGFLPFLALSILSAALLLGGLLEGGLGMAREWEAGTIRELMLSPARPVTIVAGKLVAAFLLALAGAVVSVAAALALGVPLAGAGAAAGVMLAVLCVFVSVGLAVGTLLRSQRLVLPLSFAVGLPLFFLSGPFGPMEWSSPGALGLARLFPIYYANGLLQRAFFGFWPLGVSPQAASLVLATWTVAALAAAVVLYGRATAPRGGRW